MVTGNGLTRTATMITRAGRQLSDDDLRRLRSRSQELTMPRVESPLAAVTRLVGVQAQDSAAASCVVRASSW